MINIRKQSIIAFFCIGLSIYSAQVLAEDKILDKHTTDFFASKDHCWRAANGCMLMVEPSRAEQEFRTYKISQICSGWMEYQYQADLKDQLSSRQILGRKFCHGIVSVSNMDLPFASSTKGVKNANDGILLIEAIQPNMTRIITNLKKLINLAELALQDSSDQDRKSLDVKFQALLGSIDNISNIAQFNKIAYLAGGRLDIPIHHDKDFITIQLMNTDSKGLNIDQLDIRLIGDAKKAIPLLADALQKVSLGLENILSHQPSLHEAAQKDAVITTVDLTGNEFIVNRTRPSLIKG